MIERYGLPRSSWEALADEWIFCERDRKLFRRRYLDGIRFEPLAEEFDMSVRQVKRVCSMSLGKIVAHIA